MKTAATKSEPTKLKKHAKLPMYKERMSVIPCSEYDSKQIDRVQFYIGQPKFNHHPVSKQRAWLSVFRNYVINIDVEDSLWKLGQISDEKNVSLVELYSYALNYPTDDDPNPKPVKYERAEVYDLKLPIKSRELAEEINLLANLIFVEKDIFAHSCKSFFMAYTTYLVLQNLSIEILSQFYKDISKTKDMTEIHEFCTYEISVKMDCYGAFIPDELFFCMNEARLLDEDFFVKIVEASKLALENFLKVKTNTKNFKLLDIKAMKSELNANFS